MERGTFAPRTSFKNEYSVFIGNLAWSVDENLVREMVADVVGANLLQNVRIAIDRETGRSKGFGHLDFGDQDTANRAVELLNNLEVEGRLIRADHAQNKAGGSGSAAGSFGDRAPRYGGNGQLHF
jgi:nucleolin